MLKKLRPYVISVLLALAVGAISALLTGGGRGLYGEIVRPPLSPPSWLFPTVWTVLFFLMGLSAADVFVRRERDPDAASLGLAVYVLQLALNLSWSIFFFNGRLFLFSFFWLLALLAAILVMLLLFRRVSPRAAKAQIPYVLWVAFAGYLTLAIAILN